MQTYIWLSLNADSGNCRRETSLNEGTGVDEAIAGKMKLGLILLR